MTRPDLAFKSRSIFTAFFLATIFLLPRSSAQTFTNLLNFVYTNGTKPSTDLIISGNTLFGATSKYGPNSGSGTVFRMNTDGSSFTNLHTFSGGTDGGEPNGPLLLAGNKLYGTTDFGGSSNNGTIFSINRDGSGLTNLYNFRFLDVSSG